MDEVLVYTGEESPSVQSYTEMIAAGPSRPFCRPDASSKFFSYPGLYSTDRLSEDQRPSFVRPRMLAPLAYLDSVGVQYYITFATLMNQSWYIELPLECEYLVGVMTNRSSNYWGAGGARRADAPAKTDSEIEDEAAEKSLFDNNSHNMEIELVHCPQSLMEDQSVEGEFSFPNFYSTVVIPTVAEVTARTYQERMDALINDESLDQFGEKGKENKASYEANIQEGITEALKAEYDIQQLTSMAQYLDRLMKPSSPHNRCESCNRCVFEHGRSHVGGQALTVFKDALQSLVGDLPS
eukprot:GFYU01007874.1.p1 GENE.GFYU01007874.1~~GFYU01007874.1.p1  ORF type:complete len:323 (-),score=76.15 GFYU01007874.1:69-956(-)